MLKEDALVMTVSPPRRSAVRRPVDIVGFVLAVSVTAAGTLTTVGRAVRDQIDSWMPAPDLAPRSVPGQLIEALALVVHPYVVLLVMLVVAVRAARQRHRRLSLALGVGVLGIPLWELQRHVVARERPHSAFADSLSAAGPAYPSGHVVAVTILIWMVVTLANAERRSTCPQWLHRTWGVALVAAVATGQWAMRTQRWSDLVGGVLLGSAVATGALLVSGVDGTRHHGRLGDHLTSRRGLAAVIYNPTKFTEVDPFRRRVTYALARAGWEPPLWFETRVDDPGSGVARDALSKNVSLVIVAGGDGTVRSVGAELTGSGVPLAVIPAGTGNLLVRNLGIPLDEDEALQVALRGAPHPVDVVRWTVDGVESPSVVMAGVGLDAQIMQDVHPTLKRLVKSVAYVVSGVQQVRMPPFRARVTLDGSLVHDGEAVLALVGNVGRLQGGLQLLPAANASDGALHLVVASGHGLRGLARLVATVRRDGPNSPFRRLRGQCVQIETDRPVRYQVDGDAEGLATRFSASVDPGALLVKAPG